MATTWQKQPAHIKRMFEAHGGQAQWEREARDAQIEAEQTAGSPHIPSPPEQTAFEASWQNGGSPGQWIANRALEQNRSTSDYIAPKTTTSSPATTTSTPASAGGPWASPMPGYLQFEPGGAIYANPGNVSAEYIFKNQDQFAPVPQMQWAEDYGTEPFYPEESSMWASPSTDIENPMWRAEDRYAWDPVGWESPGHEAIHQAWQAELARRQIIANQQRLADYVGVDFGYDDWGGGYGGGNYGGGSQVYSSSPYYQQPYFGSTPPVVVDPVTGYQQDPTALGIPHVSLDPLPEDAYMTVSQTGQEPFSVAARARLNTWLQGLGYSPQGDYGTYGAKTYERPEGFAGPVRFTEEDFARLDDDPAIRKWIQWLMGQHGYSALAPYPGAVAP